MEWIQGCRVPLEYYISQIYYIYKKFSECLENLHIDV